MMKRILVCFLAVCLLTVLVGSSLTLVSAAETVYRGDADRDGAVTTADVRKLLRVCVGKEELSTQTGIWCDFDCDGKLSSRDVRRVFRQVVNKEETQVPDYVHITQDNAFGERAISVIGGSVSYGAACGGDVAQNSYVGRVQQAVNAATGCNNYGFASVRAQTWEADASIRSYGVHAWPKMNPNKTKWAEEHHQDYLLSDGFTATERWNYMDFTLREGYAYDYFCVYYQEGPDRGIFSVERAEEGGGVAQTPIGGSGTNINCAADKEATVRTAFYRMSDFGGRPIRITVQSEGKRVTVTGIGYYNDISDTGVVVNNFASGGLMLSGEGTPETGVSYDTLKAATTAQTVIFALGYNDSHFPCDRELFTQKVDYLIDLVKANGTNLIVNDMCWYIPAFSMDYDNIQWFKKELQRLARETNALYIDQQAIYGDALISTIADGAHPNAAGHKMIADAVLEAMDLKAYEPIDYVNVQKTDAFGDRSIAILGDSISHGACSVDIPNNSYVGLLKQAVNAETGDNNYGFTTVEGTMWGAVQSTELHAFPSSSCGYRGRHESGAGWAEYRTAELLGIKGLGHTKQGEWLEFSPKKNYKYFCVYYQGGPDQGEFTVSTNGGKTVLADVNGNQAVSCTAAEAGGTRTAFYDMSKLVNNKIRLTVSSSTGKEVIITGIGYYDDPKGVVVANYSNGGLQFAGTGKAWNGDVTGIDKKYLALAATSETLIFALGYNDAHFSNDRDVFLDKMDFLIAECRKNGTQVIVNDLCWYIPDCTTATMDYDTIQWYKAQLRRLAAETNGVYVDQQAISGDAIIGTIADGAHPSAAGHKVIAQNLLRAMHLA